MANNRNTTKEYDIRKDKKLSDRLVNIDGMINNANMTIYGAPQTDDIMKLDTEFKKLLDDHLSDFNDSAGGTVTSFLGSLIDSEKRRNDNDRTNFSLDSMINNEQNMLLQTYVLEAYRNKMVAQSDLHEVSNKIIELKQAISIMTYGIITADGINGRVNRTLDFKNINDEDKARYISTVENIEKKFGVLEKIKSFFVPKSLEYGNYYVYTIPYSEIFSKFEKDKDDTFKGFHESADINLESFVDTADAKSTKNKKFESKSQDDSFIEQMYSIYTESHQNLDDPDKDTHQAEKARHDGFVSDLKNIMSRISINSSEVPLPILEEGYEAIEYLLNSDKPFLEATKYLKKGKTLFEETLDDGKEKPTTKDYSDIRDCYVKMMDPIRMIPIKIMDTTIGYMNVLEEDVSKLNGALSSTLYYTKFDEHSKEATIVDALAEKVIKAFNKPFLMKNLKFKKAIADCIQYYNLNEKKIKFQFIPAEYVTEFKIDVDEHEEGQSMIASSLFYAKLYLMLLLFNIMTVVVQGNDQKVNYVKTSGIDKDVANKINELIRIKQNRQINITDLFSYTTLINKVGKGTEAYIPVGRSGERPIETEILQGQDVNMHTETLETLRNGYNAGHGVPAAYFNYLNEPDFAVIAIQQNAMLNSRCIHYQLDLNPAVTDFYKKLLRYCTDIPEQVIENFEFAFVAPKTALTATKLDSINNFNGLIDFLVQLFFEDPTQAENPIEETRRIKEFKILMAKQQLPGLNIDNVQEFVEKAKLEAEKTSLKPNPNNGDSGDDIGLEDIIQDDGSV